MNTYRKNKGFITLTLLGIVVSIGILLVFGYVIALSVAAGFSGGSLAAWLIGGLRNYPNHYIDVRDTD